ncbi:L-aspartate oxidase [Neobacillus sp. D3-1R]|uniref:L-aspartate oxidase n=1 Tax=Neobacillus sp. D3-1R TaxID=3445778 RepID=UPI003F9FD647
MTYSDVLIIGSGIAALQLASQLSQDKNVRIITKSTVRTANSYLAQGGIAAAIGKEDHPDKHHTDTLEAGRFHNHEETVRKIIDEAPKLIQEMYKKGCHFDHDSEGNLLLGMEGAHSEKRIVHGGGDATGKRMIEFLLTQLKANIFLEENIYVYELIVDEKQEKCIGVKGKRLDGSIEYFFAQHIVLATGGCGQLYSFTSNAETVTGDGIVMAYLAGAEIADMEFIQFHPTLLYVNGETKGLVSEAVRGEGAILVDENDVPIMEGVHPYKDLAPRHVVSQTIYENIKKGKQVFLDISNIKNFENRFPSITLLCTQNDIKLKDGKIPVVPGSHFLMGGIKTDFIGRSSIKNLYAIGEASCTGLHGANRLASNSLLEGLYQGKMLAELINVEDRANPPQEYLTIVYPVVKKQHHLPDIVTLQTRMMEYVGIVRSKESLTVQRKWLDQFGLKQIGRELDGCSSEDLTKIFMLTAAKLITNAALLRTESRGGHFRSDYPFEDDLNWCKKQIVYQRQGEKSNEYVKAALAN